MRPIHLLFLGPGFSEKSFKCLGFPWCIANHKNLRFHLCIRIPNCLTKKPVNGHRGATVFLLSSSLFSHTNISQYYVSRKIEKNCSRFHSRVKFRNNELRDYGSCTRSHSTSTSGEPFILLLSWSRRYRYLKYEHAIPSSQSVHKTSIVYLFPIFLTRCCPNSKWTTRCSWPLK